jgi:serine/threonine protein kinase
VKLLKQLLSIDPEKRITPDAALSHPFITLTHLAEYSNSEVLVIFLFFTYVVELTIMPA